MENAKEQAKAQFNDIKEMIEALDCAESDSNEYDDAATTIYEKPLSVEVRSGWNSPGGEMKAEEFRILLCTGGPAVQIVGDLNQYGEPESAILEYQDWFQPWAEYCLDADEQDILLSFCQQFYFGE